MWSNGGNGGTGGDPQKPAAKTGREFVHLHPHINEVISYLQIFAALLLVIICGNFDFWSGSYFKWGAPVLVHSTEIKEAWHFWLLWSMFFFDGLVAALDNKVIGHMRANEFDRRARQEEGARAIAMAPEEAEKHMHSFAYVSFIIVGDHAINWLRYSTLLVFVYAQISFAVAFSLPSIIITVIRGKRALTKHYHPASASVKGVAAEDKSIWFKIPPLAIFFIQLAEIAAFMIVFWVTGFMKSSFFHFGPKVSLFGTEIRPVWAYVLLIFFACADQILSTLNSAIVGPWINNEVYNNSCASMTKTQSSTYAIFVARKFVNWTRIIMVVTFASAQIMFVVSMFLGDMTATFLITWATWSRTVDNKPDEFVARTMPGVSTITGLMVFEAIGIIVVALSFKIWQIPYFQWPPPLIVFDTILSKTREVAVILLFAVIDRVVDTLTSEILYPYINNVIYGNDQKDKVYTEEENERIIFINLITGWMRRIVAYNFLFSNVSFIIFAAAVDIPLSTLILYRYLRYKRICLFERMDEDQELFKLRPGAFQELPAMRGPQPASNPTRILRKDLL